MPLKKKSEKYRKNSWIVKIISDSVSTGLIYVFQLKNPKSKNSQEMTF